MRSLTATLLCAAALCLSNGCQKVTVEGEHGEKLTLVKLKDETIERGETGTIDVRVSRKKTDRPVRVRLEDLPPGVRLVEAEPVIPAGQESVVVKLQADPSANLVKSHRVKVRLEGQEGLAVDDSFVLTVRERGGRERADGDRREEGDGRGNAADGHGRTITIAKIGNQTIQHGDKTKVTVKVKRDKTDQPVKVRIEDLPAGVRIVESETVIPAGKDEVVLTLEAEPKAETVSNKTVKVFVAGEGGGETSETFVLNVKG